MSRVSTCLHVPRPGLLIGAGGLALALGLLVYVADRDPSHAVWIPAVAVLAGSHLFGALGQWLPSFVHPFACSLFTVAVLPGSARPRYGACVAWFAVNAAFELGQHPQLRAPLADALRQLGPAPLATPLANYFLHGTFDPGDLLAVALGAGAAAAWLRLTHGLSREHEHVD